jgi:hypothetical protein
MENDFNSGHHQTTLKAFRNIFQVDISVIYIRSDNPITYTLTHTQSYIIIIIAPH